MRDGYKAMVFGASGGVGAALVRALADDPRCAGVQALARKSLASAPKITAHSFDLEDEASICEAVRLASACGPPDLAIVATGLLHDGHMQPEKTFRALDPALLAKAYAINAIGPALIARHVLPLLPRDSKSVFAALSARVGSISDNRTGGWHAYRASKAALNMLVRTCAIELRVKNPAALCVTLHPGTVDTTMSKPFQANVPAPRLFAPETAAAHLLTVIDRLTPADSGQLFAWDGAAIPF